jgi:hypothetical protein
MVSVVRSETPEVRGHSRCLPDAEGKCFIAVKPDLPVELLLPEGLSCPWLWWSGWSPVVGVDAVGGPPHGDITDEVDVQLRARWRPHGLSAVVAGVTSNLVSEVVDQLRSLGEIVLPFGVFIAHLGDSG